MKNRIVRLALANDELIAQAGAFDGCYSLTALLEEVRVPVIIVIDGLNPDENKSRQDAFQAIYRLRRSAVFYAAPIYLTKSMGSLDLFVDGIGSTPEDILPYAAAILARMKNISSDTNAATNDLRLLTFLYCRGEEPLLTPAAIPSSPWIYEYPAAYLIGGYAEAAPQPTDGDLFSDIDSSKTQVRSSAEWLVSLHSQGVLATQELMDRIRLCPYCNTGNLNYIDSCPLCGSIDFSKRRMVHCFTCSHVAPEENFKSGMMFICPRCNTQLRHIGSDYDRPVEAYSCNRCGERFVEPDVKAACLKCRRKSPTDELTVRQLYTYSLTEKGKKAVLLGNIDLEFSLFDNHRNVLPQFFYQIIDWLVQMKARYSDAEFTLLGIKIIGLEDASSTAGIERFQKLVDELAGRIRELVRLTDITTSTGANTFWVLLPRTNLSGGEILASRIAKLADLVAIENSGHIDIRIQCFSIPEEYASRGQVAEMLLRNYEAALTDAT